MKTRSAGFTAAVILSGAAATAVHAGDWTVENATRQMWFADMKPRHLAVNAEGRPCAVFGGDHLYYAERDASGVWQVVTVDDTPGVGRYASLALHQGASPRIVYAGSGTEFGYAEGTRVGGEWQWTTETIPGEGFYSSLALDSSGQPHIAYYQSPYGMRYIKRGPGGWSTPSLHDTPGDPGRHYSIVVDSNGDPHIVSVTISGILYYHYQDAGGWHRVPVSTAAHAGVAPCLRITSNFLHLVFFVVDDGRRPDPRHPTCHGGNRKTHVLPATDRVSRP